ncbi:hypothetical protein Fmac_008362 [Flemingia macrophylla]|uniref:Uncharacterized protein n=1 Tax=Flemingia macrophylla TaxID=520843 RepID=A0ABD1MX58_9FABA
MASKSQQFSPTNDVIVIRGINEVARDTSPETRKLDVKLDAFVNLVTKLAVYQKSASVARVLASVLPKITTQITRNDVIVIKEVHDVATDTSAKTRKLETKLDALVNLVTQLTMNQKFAFIAIFFGIHFSIDHPKNVCPSLQQSGVNEHHEVYAANIYSKQPQQ